MRRALPLAVLVLLSSLALPASAQAPDPEEVVDRACAAAGDLRDLLPVCPREEPAAPPPEAPEDAPAAAPAEEGAATLAAEAVDAVQDAAADPSTAPDRLAAFVATLLQFLKDLLSLPALGARAAGDAMLDAGAYVAETGAAAFDALAQAGAALGSTLADAAARTGALAGHAWSSLVDLFAPAPVASGPAPLAPDAPATGVAPADGLLARTLDALPTT